MIKYNLKFLSGKLFRYIDLADLNSNEIQVEVNW